MQKHEQIISPRNVCTTKTKIVDSIKNKCLASMGFKNNDGNKLNSESRCANYACIITGIIFI